MGERLRRRGCRRGAPPLPPPSPAAPHARSQEPGWPLAPAGPFRSAAALCEAVSGLPSRLRLHTYALPARLVRGGLLPRLAPTFNRGYPVEEYTLEHMARGPFTEADPGRADAFLLPVHPYSLRVAAFPADGLAPVQAAVAEAVELVKARHAKHWAARGGCDHVLVSAHDKGGRVAQTADEALIRRGVLIVNTADRAGNAEEWGRYTAGKDVSGIPSFSTSLPAWAARLGACAADGAERRPILASFVGGSMGDVRPALFEHWRQRPWPALRLVHGHLSPADYMRTLRASRFCLHVRGTQVQSPRLIEALLFGCVPVVVADTYDLPLAGLLDWSAFSVRAPQGDPAAVRAAVEAADYERLRRGVCAARRFFTWHAQPQPGDAFWMTMLELSGRLAAARPGCNGTAGGGALGGQRV